MSGLERLQEIAPEALARLQRANELAWEALEPALLELVQHRIATLLGSERELATRTLSGREQACLAFTDRFVLSVSNISEEHTRPVLEHLEPAELYGLVCALYVFEARQRLELSLGRIFETVAA